nr:L,D-transpeptidase [Clostridia bacterium]
MPKRMLTALLCALMMLPAQAEEAAPAPADPVRTPGRETCGKPNCYWETAMDFRNEEAMWAMLTAPMTVVDGNFRAQADIYQEPSEESKIIAEVTRTTQGVHVLETLDNGWSKIECYSSSFAGSKVKAWNALTTGYIQTEQLKEVEVRTEFGLIVDKLTQRLYVYQEGKLFDELIISTGLGTKKDPENETRSGEYLLFSPTGDFWSGDLLCKYGIRYNDGDLLHEVPHTPKESGPYYGSNETRLGQRASHGCIRVQRKRTENGVNMRWLWLNLRDKMSTRMIIWEDWQGRQIPIPEADTPLYYNPKGGKNYHDSPTCYGVADRYEPMPAFTYGELEDEAYRKLKVCTYCNPPLRKAALEEKNAAYLPQETSAPTAAPEKK